MTLFLDTNIWVSALVASGLCEDLLLKCVEQRLAVTSELVWIELEAVMTRKIRASDVAVSSARELWKTLPLIDDVPAPTDDNDARLVAAARAAGATLFVTGDRRVLDWRQSGEMRIVSPREAWIELFAPHLRNG